MTFGGEKQITSAIYKLTSAEQSHAYYTTNHGEQTLTDSLTDALDAQNIDAQPLDLLTSTIPEDCDLLIINAPTTDFSAGDGLVDEISQLQNYLAAGGKLLLTSSCLRPDPAAGRRAGAVRPCPRRGHGGGGRQQQGTV